MLKMNKEVCKHCLAREGYERRFCELDWMQGRVYCLRDDFVGADVQGYRKLVHGPSKFCPFLLEHLMANQPC